jgi:hypothetical protein
LSGAIVVGLCKGAIGTMFGHLRNFPLASGATTPFDGKPGHAPGFSF